MIAHKIKINDEEKEFAIKISEMLEPGDIILTQTPGSPAYEVLRALSNSYFDHVGVFLNKESCLHVGPPRAQLISTHYFLIMNRKPLVLRLPSPIRSQFLENAKSLLGKDYNFRKVLNSWISVVLLERANFSMKIPDPDPNKVICTDAILGSHPNIEGIRKKFESYLDYTKTGSHSINDFLTLAERGEMEIVKLPFPLNTITSQEGKDYKLIVRRLQKKESVFSSIINLNNFLQTKKLMSSIKKKRYRNAYRLVVAAAQIMKMMKIKGVEAFHILSFLWPRL